jgi:Zn-dependent peptidase ImmA (M78 family)
MTIERIHSINPERILWSCSERGITLEELIQALGLPESAVQRILSREGITFTQLRRIADYLGRGVLFFLESDEVTAEQIHTPQFRTLANQKPELSSKIKTLIERVERQREVYLSLVEDLADPDWKPFEPPTVSSLNVQAAAGKVREWLELGTENDFLSYRLAVEAKGVLVFRSNGYSGKWQIPKDDPILGFTIYDSRCPVILIKKQSESRQSFTLMHELAHTLRHKVSSIDDEGDLVSHDGSEQDANAFAGYLLVPDVFLETIDHRSRPKEVSQYDIWLEEKRNKWGVSGEVILRRLLDVGRLSRNEYQAYRSWRAQTISPVTDSGSRSFRHREPRHIFGDTFVRTVLQALHSQNLTLTRASTYLDSLKIQDLHKLEKYYAGL